MDSVQQTEQGKFFSCRTQLRFAGAFILMAFVLYGGGQAFISADHQGLGIAMILINSIAVLAIGVIFRSVILKDSPRTANIYLTARITEGILLGAGSLLLVLAPASNTDWNAVLYQLGMIALGIGSISFCRWLLMTKQIPALLAWLGIVGYPLLVLGMLAAFAGMDFVSMILLVPGAVFELIFGLFLLFKGEGNYLNSAKVVLTS
jgi:hypothetical protein